MLNWSSKLSRPESVGRVNRRLSLALSHCPPFEHAGWHFRCAECHVGTGTYARGQSVAWHLHQGYQIEIGLGGCIEFETRTDRFELRAGEALMIPWKTLHRWKCRNRGPMLGVMLDLNPSMASVARDGWLFSAAVQSRLKHAADELDELLRLCLAPADPAFGGHELSSRLFLILSALLKPCLPLQSGSERATAAEVRGREQVAWALHYVDENLGTRFRMEALAGEMKISSRQLHRLFIKHTGKSLHDILLERRLERARQLMGSPGHGAQIKEIAFNCGFNSLAYFSNSFRRAFGMSPSEFRSPRD